MIILIFVNITNTITEFAGVAAAAEIFGTASIFGDSSTIQQHVFVPLRFIVVPLAAFFVWWLILKGNYKTVERVFLWICLFYVAYMVSGFLVQPDWSEVGKATVIPHVSMDKMYLMMIIGIIGTTIAPWMQFYMQSSIVEKGIKKEDYRYTKIDVIVGCLISVLVAFFIVITTAPLFFNHLTIGGNAGEAAIALAPVAGPYAEYLFAFGLLIASLFAAAILPLSTAYSVCEGFGWELGVNRKFSEAKQFYILYTALIVIGAVVVLIPGFSLVTLMYFSQVLNGILLPVIIIFMLMLINKSDLMGTYKNSRLYNWIAYTASGLIICLTLAMVFMMLFGG
jgi:Mn2+/Fe2+ NRAMP family transporter